MIALISDIHGNYPALSAVLDEIEEVGVERIFCLGDVAGYYCQINECCEELRRRRVECVLGNHEWHLISGVPFPRSRTATNCIRYQKKTITADNLEWLRSFPVIRIEDQLAMVHGGWLNPIDEYLDVTECYFDEIAGSFFASGHTHRQCKISCEGGRYCNPGSVGQPRDGDCRAAYALFNGQDFELRRTNYNIEAICTAMNDEGFDEYLYERLWHGWANFTMS